MFAMNGIILTPKVTSPGPLAFGLKPSTLSFSVGSDLQIYRCYKGGKCKHNAKPHEREIEREREIPQKVH